MTEAARMPIDRDDEWRESETELDTRLRLRDKPDPRRIDASRNTDCWRYGEDDPRTRTRNPERGERTLNAER